MVGAPERRQSGGAADGGTGGNDRGHGISWQDVAWLMLSDVVGTSVLTFNGVALQLGYVPSVIFIVGLFPVSLFVSVLMSRTRTLLVQTADLASPSSPPPRVDTMGEVARCAFGSSGAGTVVNWAVYGYTLLGQGSYLLVLGTALQMTFYTVPICLYVAVAIGCLGLIGPIFLVRRLGESVLLCLVNSLLIAVVVVVALAEIGMQRRPSCGNHAFAPGLDLMTALGAATNVVYAYSGQWMYFELMETMAVPEDFPRAFSVSGPFMVVTYLVVALLGYSLGAGDKDLVQGMDQGSAMRVVAVMLFAHVAVVYLVKSVVLARYFHGLCRPGDVESRSLASYGRHGGWGVAMLVFGFLVANAVPFFSQLLGIIGGLLAGPINFLLPIVLYLLAFGRRLLVVEDPHRRQAAIADAEIGSQETASRDSDGASRESWQATSEDGEHISITSSCSSEQKAVSCCHLIRIALRSLPIWEVVFLLIIVFFIVMTMFIGVADEVGQVIKLQKKLGAPFSCHALVLNNASAVSCQSV